MGDGRVSPVECQRPHVPPGGVHTGAVFRQAQRHHGKSAGRWAPVQQPSHQSLAECKQRRRLRTRRLRADLTIVKAGAVMPASRAHGWIVANGGRPAYPGPEGQSV
jgi:hypothetical protein